MTARTLTARQRHDRQMALADIQYLCRQLVEMDALALIDWPALQRYQQGIAGWVAAAQLARQEQQP